MCRLIILFNVVTLCILIITSVSSLSDWDFNLLRFEYNTSDPEVIDFNMRSVRASPGVYALNGSCTLGVDADDRYSVSLKLYRSAAGNSQFKATPYEISKTSFYKFMTSIYVKMLQTEFSKCTNLPVHEKSFDSPLKKGTYVFNKCIVTNEGMPGHVQPGLYKATAVFSGENVELWISVYFEVNGKSMG